MILSPSEFATILAALRFFQDEFQTAQPAELVELFPQFETAPPLSRSEIGSLCERLSDEEAVAKLVELGIAEANTAVPEYNQAYQVDGNGLLLDATGKELFCDYCEARAISHRAVSVEGPHDDGRNLCYSCDAVYTVGVQHGRWHEAARHGTRPGSDSSQAFDTDTLS